MGREEGMALAPWGVLGSGMFKTAEQRASNQGRQVKPSEDQIKVRDKLEVIAKRLNTQLTSVALAYVMHKSPYVFPIVGGRNIEHLKGNIEALKLHLTDAHIEEIESAAPFDLGFPSNMLYGSGKTANPLDVAMHRNSGVFDYVPLPKVCHPGINVSVSLGSYSAR
jgi:diketogulonate reductase-like aldo/keto reductase